MTYTLRDMKKKSMTEADRPSSSQHAFKHVFMCVCVCMVYNYCVWSVCVTVSLCYLPRLPAGPVINPHQKLRKLQFEYILPYRPPSKLYRDE